MKRQFRLYLVFVLIVPCFQAVAQQEYIDSLSAVAQKTTDLKDKGRLYIKIGNGYNYLDTAKAKSNLENGLKLANQAGDEMGRGMYYMYLGFYKASRSRFNDALTELESASGHFNKFLSSTNLKPAEKEDADGMLLEAEFSRANILLELYEYDSAVNMFWKVLDLINKTNFPDKIIATASTYQSIALAYFHQSQYPTALKYYLESLPYSEKTGNKYFHAKTNIYIAASYIQVQRYDSAANYLKNAREVATTTGDAFLKTMYYARSAELARYTDQCGKAVGLYDSTVRYAALGGDKYMQSTFTTAKSECLFKLNRLVEARKAGLQGLALAVSISKKREIMEAQKILSKIEAAQGNHKQAYLYLKEYKDANDSLHTSELAEKIQTLDKKYQAQLKEEKISQLEKDKELQAVNISRKNLINYLLAGVIVIVLLLLALAYRNYKQKQKLQQQRINELETEKKLAATEAVLKGEEQERTRLAKDLHDGLGGMLSGIKHSLNTMKGNLIMTPENAQAFERSIDMLDSSIQEMRRVAHNMMPEGLVKFGLNSALKDFCNDINHSGALNVKYQSIGMENATFNQITSITIYRIVQELINNTIKHGAAKTALVQLTKTDGIFSITVEDDGKGFDTSILRQSRGIGWINIQNRVDFLKGKMDVQSEPGKGTSVHIELNA